MTGGNRGLGRATALALAEAGTDVILTYRTGKDDAASAPGRTAVAVELDTARFDTFPAFATSVRDALRTTWDRDSSDFLVNNAGAAALLVFTATPGTGNQQELQLQLQLQLLRVLGDRQPYV
ncbi:SDR family NAD(P)-dependent oxidoreductase [Streptomyces sp. PSRA5]|uniref:SDR family NAD(P)-dependent oxidoreductase n=1 Tax=Streptomyces panacea TaxID=3035064 RepID=UPI00339BF207